MFCLLVTLEPHHTDQLYETAIVSSIALITRRTSACRGFRDQIAATSALIVRPARISNSRHRNYQFQVSMSRQRSLQVATLSRASRCASRLACEVHQKCNLAMSSYIAAAPARCAQSPCHGACCRLAVLTCFLCIFGCVANTIAQNCPAPCQKHLGLPRRGTCMATCSARKLPPIPCPTAPHQNTCTLHH